MKEFMLLIRNEIDHQASWSPEQQRQFLKNGQTALRLSNRDRQPTPLHPLGVAVRLIPARWWPVPNRKTNGPSLFREATKSPLPLQLTCLPCL